jgi:PHS family inorganic phosphate transporter-like MFS transporter
LPSIKFGGVKASNPNSSGIGWVFIIFGFIMALGALFAWVWIPVVQNNRDEDGGLKLPSKKLEVLEEGLERARHDGQVIGMRNNFQELVQPLLDSWNKMWTRAESVDGDM